MARNRRRILQRAREAGWRVTRIKSGYRVWPPTGKPITIHHTPSDVRAAANLAGDFKRAGLRVDRKDLM